MGHDVVAIQRRDRVALAAVVAETTAADGSALLTLVAEDGAKFPFPAAQALARAGRLPPQGTGEALPAWLGRIRTSATMAIDWRGLHAQIAQGADLSAEDLALLGKIRSGLGGNLGPLAVALASSEAGPWFRREGVRFIVVPEEQAEAKLARIDAVRREAGEDEALRAWWPRRTDGPPPEVCRPAVYALAEFALRGPLPETERGRVLAAKFDLPEPDHVLEALVAAGALPGDVNPAPFRAGLAEAFSRAATAEAERTAETPVDPAGREDLTHLHAVAVDDAETTDVDDAISLRRGADGVEVLVHIADVAAAIPVGSALDRVAYQRASSLYTPEAAVAMLPVPMVARLSLEAGTVREAVTGVFRIGDDGRVAAARFVRSIVKVTSRLTYEATADPAALSGSADDGHLLVAMAERLRAARRESGATVVSLDSLKVSAAGGVPQVTLRHQATPGDLVVGELMVLFNREAARLLAAADAPAFYRSQAAPRDAEPAADDPLYPLRVRRRFAPSNVSIEPARHHGVGVDAYLQATSPIRRYADLVNQRQLAAVVGGQKPPHRHADLERIVAHVVERERAIRIASDERTDHWIARAFEPSVGGTIDGILSRPPRRGMGSVWVPALCRELPLRPPAGWIAPAEGTAARWRVARVAPWRGRIELEPI